MTDDEPAGRIAARVVVALPRRARVRAILSQLIGGGLAAAVAADIVTPLARAIADSRAAMVRSCSSRRSSRRWSPSPSADLRRRILWGSNAISGMSSSFLV